MVKKFTAQPVVSNNFVIEILIVIQQERLKSENREKKKTSGKKGRQTYVNKPLIVNTRIRSHRSLNGLSKSLLSKDILGKDIDICLKNGLCFK